MSSTTCTVGIYSQANAYNWINADDLTPMAAVQRAIRKSGYVVNQHARSLVTQRSQSVAFVLSEPQERLFEDPNFHMLMRGCTSALAEHDITLVMAIAGADEERKRVSRYVTSGHVDGVLLVSAHRGNPLLDEWRGRGIRWSRVDGRWTRTVTWRSSQRTTATGLGRWCATSSARDGGGSE